MEWDVFISHASEDKETFVRNLAEELRSRGLKVWYDEFTLALGDNLRRSIDKGLASSRYGVVVLSAAFFKKEWTKRELDGLTAREISHGKVILPIWHGVTRMEVLQYSPTLADKVAIPSTKGLLKITETILQTVAPNLLPVPPPARNHGDAAQIPVSIIPPKVFPDVSETAWHEPINFLAPSVGAFIVSPDNRHLAYIATRGEKIAAVLDGRYSDDDFDLFSDHTLVFSPDSQRVADAMSRGEKWLVILDRIISDEYYDEIPNHGISFSPDSSRLAFQAKRGDECVVVVDGIEGKPYQNTSIPFFSPDSKKIAYFGRRGDSTFLVVNGREVDEVEIKSRGKYRFTPDNSRVEFIEEEGVSYMPLSWTSEELAAYAREVGMSVNEVGGTDMVPTVPGSLVRSPDNKRAARIVRFNYGISVIVDGHKMLVHEAVLSHSLVFSPNSMHVAYAAEDYGLWRLVVDGVVSETAYDDILNGSKPHFLNSNILNIVVVRNGRIYYVETEVG